MDTTNCYLSIPKSERNYPIYRIISLNRLYELFEQRVNTLVKPHKWEDPFENCILGLTAQLPTGEMVEFGQRHNFYGQCWTLRGASDAMWRIYSSDKQSVRIQVRIRTILETLAPNALGPVFIGKVRYLSTDGLLDWARRVFRNSSAPDERLLARTLLVKRLAFTHEQEVRLLYFHPREEQPELFRYRIDPHSLVEGIVIDPRMSEEEAGSVAETIRKRTGFRGRITHSDLYAAPRDMVLRLGAAFSPARRTSRKVSYAAGLQTTMTSPGNRPQLLLPVVDRRLRTTVPTVE